MGFDTNNVGRSKQSIALELPSERPILILVFVMLAFAFPLQVLARSPIPALFPYALLGLAFVIRVRAGYGVFKGIAISRLTSVDWWILIYGLLLVAHIVANFVAGAVDLLELCSIVVNFFLPISFYLYFRLFPLKSAIRTFMVGIVIASVTISGYSVMHAFLKMLYWSATSTEQSNSLILFNRMEWFQHAAADYSRLRANEGADFSGKLMRYYGPRSSGLLESHSVTAAWIGFGMFASLGLICPLRRSWLCFFVGSIFMIMLLIFQYYTAFFAATFSLLIVFLPKAYKFIHIKKSRSKWSINKEDRLIAVLMLFLLFILAIAMIVHGDYWANVKVVMSIQLDLLLSSRGYVNLVFAKFHDYVKYIESFPFVALFGDGMGIYYSYSFNKGGDIGIVESMARLGIPMLAFFLSKVVALVCRMILRREARSLLNDDGNNGMIIFAIGIISFVVINDAHYSIWPAKSILPVLMVAFALCEMLESELES